MNLYDRLSTLSPEKRALLARRLSEAGPAPSGTRSRLVAYVVTDGNSVPDRWRDHLKATLPEYMVPATVVVMDGLPRTPNGKVDLKALPNPERAPAPGDNRLVGPRTPVEHQLVDLWAEVLGLDEVSIHDNFFEIGGDSILSIQIIARANQVGLSLQPNQLFEHQTIAELAAAADPDATPPPAAREPTASEKRPAAVQLPPALEGVLDPANVEHVIPLPSMQQALLFHVLQDTSTNLGFLQVCCTFPEGLDEAAFERAWRQVIDRHAAFRTSLHWDGLETPLQMVQRRAGLPLQRLDWRGLPEAERRLDAFLEEDRARGIDLTQAPVMRLTVIRADEQTVHFTWVSHHLILDGWSWALAFKEVFDFYKAARAGRSVVLDPPRPYQAYLDWLHTRDAIDAEAFWRRTLRGFSAPASLGSMRTTEGSPGDGYGKHTVRLTSAAAETLEAFARQHRMTLSPLVQGAWALVLNRISGAGDVVFGATVSGRSVGPPGIESMVGVFTNTIPVRVQVAPGPSVLAWLKEVQQGHLAARPYEYVPLDQIQAWSEVPGHRRLFESLVIFQNYRAGDFPGEREGRLTVRIVESGLPTNYPLSLMVVPGEALTLHLLYDRRRFDAPTAARLVEALQAALNRLVEDPKAPVASVLNALRARPMLKVEAASATEKPGTAYVAPRDELELKLTTLWENLLGHRPIGVRTSFFDLGGHSLLAVRLFGEIEQALGRRLPLVTLFEHPTIEQLAHVLRDEAWTPPWSSLVPIRPGGSKPPVFLVHAGGGEVLFYRELAECLGRDQPVYGVQALGLDGTRPPLSRIEDMAAHYLSEMHTVQPAGPYALVGRCAGNAICLEIAQQLWAAGEREVLVVLLDSGGVFRRRLRPQEQQGSVPEAVARSGIVHYVRRLGRYIQTGNWTYIKKWLKKMALRTGHELRRAWVYRFGNEQAKTLQRVQDLLVEAELAYVARPYPGTLTLIRSTEFADRKDKDHHVTDWSELAEGGLEVHIIPAIHIRMFERPAVERLAEQLTACLEAREIVSQSGAR